MKPESLTRKYKLNNNTEVIVKSKRMKGAADVYINTMTLNFITSDTKPLELPSRSAIAEYIKDVDLEDDQQSLILDDDADDEDFR